MQLGVVFPTCVIGDDPVAIRDYAQTAEGLGYDYILAYDHVLGAEHAGREPALQGPYTEQDPFHEPFVLFSWLAGQTSRIGFATGVLVLPQRQTALVAKQAQQLQVLSGGRLRLGVGTGWNWVEYAALGEPFETRGARLDEQVEVLRRLFSEDVVDFEGAYHRIPRAGIAPRHVRPIPVWFGGFTPVAVRRAARIGDGFIFGYPGREMQVLAEQLRDEAAKEGRADAPGVEVFLNHADGPDEWTKRIDEWQAVGLTHAAVRTMDRGMEQLPGPKCGFTTAREHIDALEPFIRAVRG